MESLRNLTLYANVGRVTTELLLNSRGNPAAVQKSAYEHSLLHELLPDAGDIVVRMVIPSHLLIMNFLIKSHL